ncbi:MAG TPA: YfhO family protein [Chloroflexia bacterium]
MARANRFSRWNLREASQLALLPAIISFVMLWQPLLGIGILAPTDIVTADPLLGGFPPGRVPYPIAENPVLGDVVDVFIPWKLYARSELAAGRFPLWNPYNLLGTHFHANSQSQIFSPFNLLWLLLPALWGFGAIAALKWTLCGLGMGLFLRRLGLGMAPAIFGSVALQLSGPILGWLQWPISEGLMWTPWLFWAVLGWVDTHQPTWLTVFSALVAAEMLVGHVETSFHSLAFVSLFALAAWASCMLRGKPWLLVLAGLVGAGLLGIALSAAQLLPFLDILTASFQWSVRSGTQSQTISLPMTAGLMWLTPNGFGWPDNYAGPFNWIEANPYVGASTLLLAAWGLGGAIFSRRQPDLHTAPLRQRILTALSPRKPIFWIAVLLITTSMSYGIYPLSILRELPGFSASLNWRLISVAGPCVIVLAAMGMDRLMLLRGRVLPRSWEVVFFLLALLTIFLMPLGAEAWTADSLLAAPIYRHAWQWWAALLFCAGTLLILARLRGWLRPRAFAVLIIGLLLLDMGRAGWNFNPAIDRATFFPPNAITDFLAARGPTERVAVVGTYAESNLLMPYRIADYRNYDPTLNSRYMVYSRWLSPETFRIQNPAYAAHLILVRPSATMLAAAGIKWLVCPVNQDPNSWQDVPERAPIYKLALESHDFWVWENIYARPYAYFATRFQVAKNEEIIRRRMRELTFDRVNEAHIEDFEGTFPENVAALHTGSPVTPEERDSIKLESYAPGNMTISLKAEKTRLLIVNEGWTPSWRAYIDNAPATIYRTNYILQAIVIPPGEHRVTLRYDPPAFKWGLAMSIVAALGWLALVAFSLRRARKPIVKTIAADAS